MSVPATAFSLLREAMARAGARVAVRQKRHGIWHEKTWLEVAGAADRIAASLAAAGLDKGTRVVIVADPSQDWLLAVLGIWQAGLMPVALPPDLPNTELATLIALSGARAVVSDSAAILQYLPQSRGASTPLLILTEPGVTAVAGVPSLRTLQCSTDETAPVRGGTSLVLASGSDTGPAILTTVAVAEIVAIAAGLHQAHDIGPQDSILAVLPLGDPTGLAATLFLPLLSLCVVHLGKSMRTLAEDLRQAEVTILIGPSRMWQKFHRDAAYAAERSKGLRRRALDALLQARSLRLIGRILLARPLRRGLGLRRLRVAVSSASHRRSQRGEILRQPWDRAD